MLKSGAILHLTSYILHQIAVSDWSEQWPGWRGIAGLTNFEGPFFYKKRTRFLTIVAVFYHIPHFSKEIQGTGFKSWRPPLLDSSPLHRVSCNTFAT